MEGLIHSEFWPFAVLLLGIAMVVIMITRLHFHPFVSLMLSAIFVGLISPLLPAVAGQHPLITVVELPMAEFGIVAGKIAWVIALAAVIGTAMMESGAAEQIVNWLLKTLGEKQAAMALVISGFVLSIPVFFDTVFFLLIPLGITLALKTGKNYLLYVLAICGGAVVAHTLVPPTPGPLIMADTLGIDLGAAILAGIAIGILPASTALFIGKRLNKKLNIPVRVADEHVTTIKNPPSLILSIQPVFLPIVMISLASIVEVSTGSLPGWIAFLGNKNIAMSMGTLIALLLWAKTQKLGTKDLWKATAKPLEIASIIILITSAGGAFGAMIKHSGIGDAIAIATEDFEINYIILAWIIASVMKIAQGSGTVSMITSAAIMISLMGPSSDLPYHPIYIFFAIGFGSLFITWMNDSGFWVVARMSGFTEKETLQTWTFTLACMSLVGLVETLIISWIFPFV